MEQKKIDWYLRFCWLFILISVLLICSYYIINNINSCTAQPLEYAVKQVKDKFDVSLVFGSMTIMAKNSAYDIIEFGDVNFTKSTPNNISLQIP